MTDGVISPLRRRMIEDKTIRKLPPKTQMARGRNGRGTFYRVLRLMPGQDKSPRIAEQEEA